MTSGQFNVFNRGLPKEGVPKEYGWEGNRCRSPYKGPQYSGSVSILRWANPSGVVQNHADPIIGPDGMIYAAGYTAADGYGLFALYPENGSKKWFRPNLTGRWPYTSPVLSMNGTLYICFNPSDDYETVYGLRTL